MSRYALWAVEFAAGALAAFVVLAAFCLPMAADGDWMREHHRTVQVRR